ncbi:MAG: undecaprenyldiphospho-muramoylpentapeptide beta-N-acetylglucosaminyltransferase [Desulfosarcinaceae bacterium]|nr:undecaprenyldiphospho-muramoylpentapeptide beta-N-acetylglucosaminyltransferase [Desulfosarcinaceae bacterium]
MGSVLRVVIAGGGTGGHLFPGIAIAETFCERRPGAEVMFIGSGRPLEISVLSQTGFRFDTIAIEGLKGRGRWHQLQAAFKIPGAVWSSLRKLWAFRPHLVVGVGGYSAGPVVTAAWILRIPRVLHEQNLLPGVTNRILARLANRIYTSFADTERRWRTGRSRLTGNPVRRALIQEQDPLGKGEETLHLLVMGGSQGAHALNMALIDTMENLSQRAGARLRVRHQTGTKDLGMVQAAYARHGIAAEVRPFFDDMADCYRWADLAICRAGATTVAEVTAVGVPAIFVPFPFAADDHQRLNALAVVKAGGAEMLLEQDLDGARLAERLKRYLSDRGELAQMAAAARTLGQPEAAEKIVMDSLALIEGESVHP